MYLKIFKSTTSSGGLFFAKGYNKESKAEPTHFLPCFLYLFFVLHLIEAVAIARNHNRHIGTAGKLPIVSVKKMREVVKAADSGII